MDNFFWSIVTLSFWEDHVPQFTCPTCNTGNLVKEFFRSEETSESKKARNREDWIPEFIEYRFIAQLRCTNIYCKDIISCNGDGSPNEYTIGEGESEWRDAFVFKSFDPPLHLFNIGNKCPKEIKTEIIKAFNLFWVDNSSCANKIRIAVERILNQQRVKKITKTSGKKERTLSLHERIEIYKTKKPEIAKHLMAVKWLANAGSHVGEIKRDDAINGFEILEYCIEKLYDNKEEYLNSLTERITKRKGPIS